MTKIRIGIAGYGNLGKSVELGINQNKDMELVGVFSRRDPNSRGNPLDIYHNFWCEEKCP